MFRKIIIPAIFLTGLIIFAYPIVSNWLSTKEHYTVISKHNEVLNQMTDEEKLEERKKAKEYNNKLNDTEILVEDPFSDETSETTATGYFNVLDIGETMGTIEIPSIHVNLPIYHGISENVLQQGIGHMSNSSFPVGGEGTHTALTGHRGLPSSKLFRDLDKVQEKDLFFIHTLDKTLAYEVDDIQIVLPTETTWLQIEEDKDYVTLITCEPYMINTHRLLVRGERVPYSEETFASATSVPEKGFQNVRLWVLLSGIVTIIVLTWLFIHVRRKKWNEGLR